jgi:hypothetical protein
VHADRHLSAQQLRLSAEPTIGADPWAGTFPTTNAGKLLTTKALGRRLTGQTDRWRGDVVLRSGMDEHLNCRTYWVDRTDT